MKKIILFIVVFSSILSCNSVQKETTYFSTGDLVLKDYNSFGAKVSSDTIYDQKSITEIYKGLKEGDTVYTTFLSTVQDVCEVKGCWMKIALTDTEEATVRFKAYGFFVPMDLKKDTVIVQGKAFVSETSIADLKHLAEDAGKTEDEIAAITVPKMTYSLVADGVLIKK
ncbi:hypothetical protein GCM10022393_40740 [Aquimarina addita]|uniref:DUF4920 domain-containing protein n=1 Tax=Aquimarina addita TaxID=870485 RepID=A0ABP6UTH7_9FLAO